MIDRVTRPPATDPTGGLDLHVLANASMTETWKALQPFMAPALGECHYCGAKEVPVFDTEDGEDACDGCIGEPE